ncbi:MAG TPA: DUF2268 domain-containing putative Zn-dependent protease [Cyclobacteriaceae bacterium]|jgi:hypothetical protein|nr:DUF2268 domain-containing putative Zn-dependent protease [Cyclobacteriaceae bacterium]
MKTKFLLTSAFLAFAFLSRCQNKNPLITEIVTSDLDNFWVALEKAGAEVQADALDKYYLKPGSKGIKGFMPGRIKSAENLAKVVKSHSRYYHSIKPSVDSISEMKTQIKLALVKLKDYYPDAIFPPVYFVIGALNSGGTSSSDGLIIGAEMYGLTEQTPSEELSKWLKTVLKPVNQVPHIVAHELIHFQQNYDGGSLLAASIKEGSADFIAELISGKHINQHVHEFANPKEKELWEEFQAKMDKKDFKGWLYSTSEGRPNDLGYWMGYKITKAYYDQSMDKKAAVKDILNIKDFRKFLEKSGYATKFD